MAVRPILLFPHTALSKPNQTVLLCPKSLQPLINDLLDTLYASPGVGLAAPQIGIQKRVSVIDIGRSKFKGGRKHIEISRRLLILINPVLLHGQGLQIPREGCLSVPDLLADVRRFQSVKVRTQTIEGGDKIIESQGFEALALQHEIDHLDGKLFLDRIVDLKTNLFRRKKHR